MLIVYPMLSFYPFFFTIGLPCFSGCLELFLYRFFLHCYFDVQLFFMFMQLLRFNLLLSLLFFGVGGCYWNINRFLRFSFFGYVFWKGVCRGGEPAMFQGGEKENNSFYNQALQDMDWKQAQSGGDLVRSTVQAKIQDFIVFWTKKRESFPETFNSIAVERVFVSVSTAPGDAEVYRSQKSICRFAPIRNEHFFYTSRKQDFHPGDGNRVLGGTEVCAIVITGYVIWTLSRHRILLFALNPLHSQNGMRNDLSTASIARLG